jgi:hypothetical protein
MKLFLQFPKRGNPPPLPEYYEETGDPFVFRLSWKKCTARRIRLEVICGTCKVPQEINWCEKFDKQVTQQSCHDCKEPAS